MGEAKATSGMTTQPRQRPKRMTARRRRGLLRAFDRDARRLEKQFEAELLRAFEALGREAAKAMKEETE